MKVNIGSWPVSDGYGAIDRYHILGHKGIDFAVPMDTPIPSVGDGVITALTNEGGKSFGMAVHERLSDGNEVIYGHLSGFKVQVGQHIYTGDIVGLSGSTGDSTGPHLHLQVMQHGYSIDPTPYVNVHAGPVDHLMSAAGNNLVDWLRDNAHDLLTYLNANSPSIITLAMVLCALLMMIAPILGWNTHKWMARTVGIGFVGAIWRVMVSS